MEWTTVAVIAIIAFALVSLAGLLLFRSAWNRMDDNFKNFRRF